MICKNPNKDLIPIQEIAKSAGIAEENIELYGPYKAKVNLNQYEQLKDKPNGKLVFVTCITPTPAGEGKTLTSIGLTQALAASGKKPFLCLREPSLGPVFGMKGGATGAGKSQLLPMEDINLHFTGDLHAITSAHNLMAAFIDNHIFRGNELNFNTKRPRWRRVMDMNDRALRTIECIDEKTTYGKSGFDITAASEIMAILALSNDIRDLKDRLSKVIVGYDTQSEPIMAKKLGIIGSQAVLLREAIKPNLVQTSEGQPAFIHCGPFANIAHGNSSIIATKMALKLADYVVTEGGFAADLGAEKFFDIVCQTNGLKPDVAVLVCSIKALNLQGGALRKEYNNKNLDHLKEGLKHLEKHISILKQFNLPVVVAINNFERDDVDELQMVKKFCESKGLRVAVSKVFAEGSKGGLELADQVIEAIEKDDNNFKPLYDMTLPIRKKIETIAKNIYGADDVHYSLDAEIDIKLITENGFSNLPICMAKTQNSISDNAKLKGVPKDFCITVQRVKAAAGAGFLVAIAGNMMLMPGLSKSPAALDINLDDCGNITGLR